MDRRAFLSTGLMASAAAALVPRALRAHADQPGTNSSRGERIAYYYRAHTYTCVPRHIREDFAWMRDVGTTAVGITLLEQDLEHIPYNLDILFAEAQRVGLKVLGVPSRWGALVAGAPKVPSAFACSHFDTLVRRKNGDYFTNATFGPMCSVYHPETLAFVTDGLDRMLGRWPFAMLLWDEVKAYHVLDYSPAARAALGERVGDRAAHLQGVTDFFTRANAHIKQKHPQVRTMLMLYANIESDILASAATCGQLDAIGIDGRPWPAGAGGQDEQPGKVLIGPPAERLFAQAHAAGKQSFALIENHNMRTADYALLDRYLPEVLALPYEHLIYYYYPRNLERPDEQMALMRTHLRAR